jgi:predicted dehydrogenase
MRLGLLSTARINVKLVAGARAATGVEVVAVGSRNRERAAAAAAELGIPRAHGSYEAVLEDPDVDAVYVPLPNGLHADWAIRALEAGKHVLCEKPLTRSPDEAEVVFDVAQQAGRVLAEGFMWRHHPQALRLVALVQEGAVGTLRLVRGSFAFDLSGSPDDVRWSGALAGGALMDVGCYCVSAVRLLAGEPVEAAAVRVEGGTGVDAVLAGTLRCPGDTIGIVDCAFAGTHRHSLEVVGDEGRIVIADPWHCVAPGIDLYRDGTAERIEIEPRNPYACELEDLAAAARGDAPPRFGRADGVGQARAIAALYRAAAEGRTVPVA